MYLASRYDDRKDILYIESESQKREEEQGFEPPLYLEVLMSDYIQGKAKEG